MRNDSTGELISYLANTCAGGLYEYLFFLMIVSNLSKSLFLCRADLPPFLNLSIALESVMNWPGLNTPFFSTCWLFYGEMAKISGSFLIRLLFPPLFLLLGYLPFEPALLIFYFSRGFDFLPGESGDKTDDKGENICYKL